MKIVPLAEQLRATTLQEIVGQDHIVGPKGFITRTIQQKNPLSILLFGPPGSGKTSIARLYAKEFNLRFASLSGVFHTVADLKKLIKETLDSPLFGQNLMIFIDEIHRFNRAQQDALLPLIEDGTIILVGATAENPSFYLNGALLSRIRVLALNPLNEEALEKLLLRAEERLNKFSLTPEARKLIISLAQGDGRYLMNLIENLQQETNRTLDKDAIADLLQKKSALYDKAKDQHYNFISALHKSVRGSDPDAALYWLARMLEGGEDPLFLARRLIRMATEDIGLADPQALTLAIAAKNTYETLGSPEGELALAEIAVYLALAPKSNAIYKAYNQAREIARQTTQATPPKIILNAPTTMMKQLGYGKNYQYDHDSQEAFSGQNYFPEEVGRLDLYQPVNRGFEREMLKRKNYFDSLRKQREEGL
ncbi:Replication-associated recombination protein A [Chlamydiales bacterium STE3]|nr:Replication-associated recombination protein A [Chlamydiales bacterium STE3]